jgi:protein-tyrosine-phosphatase
MEAQTMADIPEVLFVCTHNAGRSQMAAALLDREAAGSVRVTSAGSQPADELNPAVVEAMAEIGIDISREIPKRLSSDQVRAADVVITMGCGDACPVYPGKRYLDWELPDPAGLNLTDVRPIRDAIASQVTALIAELSDARKTSQVGCRAQKRLSCALIRAHPEQKEPADGSPAGPDLHLPGSGAGI